VVALVADEQAEAVAVELGLGGGGVVGGDGELAALVDAAAEHADLAAEPFLHLFVIDNSGSMAEEQALLSANFAAFIDVLEAPDVKANYRIGVTTTDAGNPRCPSAQYKPEGGKLVLSSCVDRAAAGSSRSTTTTSRSRATTSAARRTRT
jgi:hypothetical protein